MRQGLGTIALTLLLLSQRGQAQVTVIAPGSTAGQSVRASDANYGPPRVVDIDALVISDGFNRSHVITEGEVAPFRSGQFWTLSRGGSTLLIIPGKGLDVAELDQAAGRRTEVRGIVRAIRPKEYVGPQHVDLDLIEDPSLPVLPPPMFDQGWPRISITAIALKDRTYEGSFKREALTGGIARQILGDPASYLGRKARIYGQFRGRNLFDDLPEGSARTPDDWVLKDGDTAVWVTGKAAKGSGWKLDPAYKGDSKSWLEVEGKPEVANGVVYLKASSVTMSKAPTSVPLVAKTPN